MYPRMKKKIEVSLYLTRAQELKIDPNFFLSEPYLRFSKVQCYSNKGWVWIEADGWTLFPPLPTGEIIANYPYQCRKIWSDFENRKPNYFHSEFLDWEYLLDSKAFNDMTGGKWETYRKNARKWPKANPNWLYTGYNDPSEVSRLLGSWLEVKQKDVQDGKLIIEFLLNNKETEGISRKYLYSNGNLVAVNVWDENWKYINFRFCIIRPEEPYLDEFARLLFYTDPIIQIKGKLINDGGSLGSMGLERFKDKLQPVRKRKVHSWCI
jgi:hypothetical protein